MGKAVDCQPVASALLDRARRDARVARAKMRARSSRREGAAAGIISGQRARAAAVAGTPGRPAPGWPPHPRRRPQHQRRQPQHQHLRRRPQHQRRQPPHPRPQRPRPQRRLIPRARRPRRRRQRWPARRRWRGRSWARSLNLAGP